MKKDFSAIYSLTFGTLILMVFACSNDAQKLESESACSAVGLMETFINSEGNHVFIYEDGGAYIQTNIDCKFELQYFDPNFLAANYTTNGSGVFIKDGSELVPVKNNFTEDFETENIVTELFKSDINDPNLFWTNFTLQSPMAKEVSEYVQLNQCIVDGSCDFLDNRIDLVVDPENATNHVLRFTSVAPTADMVTAKCSMTSGLGYFDKGKELWYKADYYIESGSPVSLVDFESSYFEQSPGPRVVITNGQLALENKFGAKLIYKTTSDTRLPLGEWFTIKVHLRFSNTNDGVLELWQDGQLLISTVGINLQTANGLQNSLEVGISATQEASILLMDNIRLSDSAF